MKGLQPDEYALLRRQLRGCNPRSRLTANFDPARAAILDRLIARGLLVASSTPCACEHISVPHRPLVVTPAGRTALACHEALSVQVPA